MKSAIKFNEDYTVALMPGYNAIVSTDVPLQRPTQTVLLNTTKTPILYWGSNNTFPQDVIADVRKDPEIGTLLDKQANLLYSGGLIWGIPGKDSRGNDILLPLEDTTIDLEIRRWLKRSNINRYLSEAASVRMLFMRGSMSLAG